MSTIVAFKGPKDILSNFYPCEIFWSQDNTTALCFQSVEHLYQYRKAIFHGCTKIAADILNAQSAYMAKISARNICVSKEWRFVNLDVMYQILMLKFLQVDEFRDVLLKTGSALIGKHYVLLFTMFYILQGLQ